MQQQHRENGTELAATERHRPGGAVDLEGSEHPEFHGFPRATLLRGSEGCRGLERRRRRAA
jgi:hypothetical protein